jgi:glycosyltransferase involved in cell wall biosynthesis
MERRLRILVSAYACEPYKGSEPNVGWQWALQIARFHDVTVITRNNNRGPIEKALASYEGARPTFRYFDLPGWLVGLKRKGMPVVLYYILWQAWVRLEVRRKMKDFDLIHHVTFNTFTVPGFWWFTGKRVVLGPLGGGQICPWSFVSMLGTRMPAEIIRSLHLITGRFNPYLYMRFCFASRILVANQDTIRRIPHSFHHKVIPLLEAGVTSNQVVPRPSRPNGGGLKMVWVGRVVKTKGLELGVRALAAASEEVPRVTLTVVGDGPEVPVLKELARGLGIADAITWHGWLSHERIRSLFEEHDVLLFTSLRDTSGNVILEAMGCGLPVITLAHHGAKVMTTDRTACRINPVTPSQTIADLQSAMVALAKSPEMRERMGTAGQERVSQLYLWDRKGEQMNEIYLDLFPYLRKSRLRVLISAYACEPYKGSEPSVGWNWALQMARLHDVTVVTRGNNQEVIEDGLTKVDGPHPKFIYYTMPRPFLDWKRSWMPVRVFYALWQVAIRRNLRRQLASFDLVHHVTFNSYRWPGFWWFCSKPVVLGPLGGGQVCPWRLLPLFGSQMAGELVRSIYVVCSPLNIRNYFTFRFATKIPVANEDTLQRIPRVFRHKACRMLETGIHLSKFANTRWTGSSTGRKFIWTGTLERRKALPLALRALAEARHQDDQLRLTIAGDGPERIRWEHLCARLGLTDAVLWAGRVPYVKIVELMAEHDAFVFTSLRDTSGNVLLEAMAIGLPVITLGHQGAAEITTEETALRIRPTTITRTVHGLAEAIVNLAHSPELRKRLGEAGRLRVEQVYSWNKKGEDMNDIYWRAVNHSTNRQVPIPVPTSAWDDSQLAPSGR